VSKIVIPVMDSQCTCLDNLSTITIMFVTKFSFRSLLSSSSTIKSIAMSF